MILNDLKQLRKILNIDKTIIVYGAGLVGMSLISWIMKEEPEVSINCIIVTERKGNPKYIWGIPVYILNEIVDNPNKYLCFVATMENLHDDIIASLPKNNFKDILCISNSLYAELRKQINEFTPEIIQELQSLKKRINSIEENVHKIENQTDKMGKFVTANTQQYYMSLSPEQYVKELCSWYKESLGVDLDLTNPKTYNEKIQWLKLNDTTFLKTRLSDKYAVRSWIQEKIGEKYLVPLLGRWNSFDEIDFNQLPDKFVIKCNHGCGWNLIVSDKDKLNLFTAKEKFDSWMKMNFGLRKGLELQYKYIKPCIIAEKYLENINNDLYDYKIWCFDGKAYFIMYLTERKTGLKMAFYDREWNKLNISYSFPISDKVVEKPDNLDEMLMLAEKLAEGFKHVRVDFYRLNDGTIKFGEMTFTPASGICKWNPPETDEIFGSLIRI